MILGLEEAPLRLDYSAIFPCRTVTTGELPAICLLAGFPCVLAVHAASDDVMCDACNWHDSH